MCELFTENFNICSSSQWHLHKNDERNNDSWMIHYLESDLFNKSVDVLFPKASLTNYGRKFIC